MFLKYLSHLQTKERFGYNLRQVMTCEDDIVCKATIKMCSQRNLPLLCAFAQVGEKVGPVQRHIVRDP